MRDRLVVTGGRGFVGTNLVARLSAAGHDVDAPSRAELDLRDERAVERYLRRRAIGTVIHAAGKVGGIAANAADPIGFFAENVVVGLSVVRAADAAGVERLVNLSSSCVYPRDRERLREEDLLTGPLEPTNEGYALAKIAVGRLCAWVAELAPDRLYRTLLPCNLYGPHDRFEGAGAHLVASVLAKTADAVQGGAPTIDVWGDGSALREFLHVDDLCSAVLHVLPRLEELPPHLNVGAGTDHAVLDYYRVAARAAGFEGGFVHDLSRPVGMRRKLLDVTRLRATGWEPAVGLDEGVLDTYRWLLAHRRLRELAA